MIRKIFYYGSFQCCSRFNGQIVNSIIPGVFDANIRVQFGFIGTDSLADLVNGLLTGLADSADKMLPLL